MELCRQLSVDEGHDVGAVSLQVWLHGEGGVALCVEGGDGGEWRVVGNEFI